MKSSDEIWHEYHSSLLSFIRQRVDSLDAEDIRQVVFLKVHEKLSTLEDDKKLESWLYQIARNAIVDYYRIKRPSSEPPSWLSDAEEDQGESVRRELSMCLLPMIKALPDKYCSALYISEIEGKPQTEVALREKLSVSGAKSRIQRGRKLLREMLHDCCEIEINKNNQLVDYQPKGARCKSC